MNKILAILPSLKKRKLFGLSNDSYTIIVFKDKTIFAKLTSKILNEDVARARAQAKADGKGFFGRMGAQMGASLNYSKRYKDMSFENIKNETEGNLVFENESITKISTRVDDRIDQGRTYYYVKMTIAGEKYAFSTEQNPIPELKKVFGSKMT